MKKTYETICELLLPVCPNLALIRFKGGSENLPDTYLVVCQISGKDRAYYSGAARRTMELYEVVFYARDRALLDPARQQIAAIMEEAGFLHVMNGRDEYDASSGHFIASADFRLIKEDQ